jgi:hypothetical protein
MNQEPTDEQPQQANQGPATLPPAQAPSPRKAVFFIVILLVIAVVVAIAGIVPRIRARAQLKDQTDALAAPAVLINPPQKGPIGREVVLPGNSYPYTDASLFARTDGYLSKWYFDIGAHVRQGQLLAIISSPEVDKQLLQARAWPRPTPPATRGCSRKTPSPNKTRIRLSARRPPPVRQ